MNDMHKFKVEHGAVDFEFGADPRLGNPKSVYVSLAEKRTYRVCH